MNNSKHVTVPLQSEAVARIESGEYMVRDYIEKLQAGEDIRKNLIALKAEMKKVGGKHAVLFALNNDLQIFYEFLGQTDPKIRKNTAAILGQLGVQDSLGELYQAYAKEDTMFVKASYLTAMRELDYRVYLTNFKERLNLLKHSEIEEANKKHVQEESKLLQEMVLTMEGYKKHEFRGWYEPTKAILLTNRNFREVTEQQLKSHRPKLFNAGVQVETMDLREVLALRTYSEILFRVDGLSSLPRREEASVQEQAREISKLIADSQLIEFLEKRHKGKVPFYFRIECKGKMDLKQKSAFTKKLGMYLQEDTEERLINSTSNYEIELRLIENKSGDFNFLLKLYTIPEERFQYRLYALPTSIAPVNAALTMELCRPYLRQGAQVLDPFCGVGTMLIERNRFLPTGDLYGVDIFGEGIEKARKNAEKAQVRVNFINRDFFDFTHEYLFDEVITNMPRVMGNKNQKDIHTLYKNFWKQVKEHIKQDSILILYCYDKELLLETIPKQEFEIKETFEISKVEGSYVFVIANR